MNTVAIESGKRNKYLYDRNAKKMVLCHPLLHHMVQLTQNGQNLESWISSMSENGIEIKGCGIFSKSEVLYYFEKFELLEDNGFFQKSNSHENLLFQMTAEEVKRSLANTPQVTFEVTERCSLACEYCGYGKFYDDYDKRESKDMKIETAYQLLDYLSGMWNSSLNVSHDRNIYIGFYGGEPLLNFPFIRDTVSYIKKLSPLHNRFTFSMTTNGLLLEKYMDFLVHHNFNLLISLDGDELSTSYRVYKNGRPAYKDIIKNITQLKTRYPEYFETRVNFNAVLHNKNSVSGIYHFFKTTFNKVPGISALNTAGIAKQHEKLFRETYSNIKESLYQNEDYPVIEQDMFLNLPGTRALALFIHKDNDFVFEDYNRLIYPEDSQYTYPTGTCTPFSKKVFITVNGKILPCERIGHRFMLGTVSPEEGVRIDFKEIARKYSNYFSKLKNHCLSCKNLGNCIQCVFNLEDPDSSTACKSFVTAHDYSQRIINFIDSIETNPGIYTRIINDVVLE